jgi:hypothetical protein
MEGFELVALNPISDIITPHAVMAKDGVFYDVSLMANAYLAKNIAKSLSLVLISESTKKEEIYSELFKYWKVIYETDKATCQSVLEGVSALGIGPTEFVLSSGVSPPYCSHIKELSRYSETLDLNRNINRDQNSTVLKSQSGGRYDRSRYANNGRPDDSYTAKKNERQQFRKVFLQDGSMRMVPFGESASKPPTERAPSAPAPTAKSASSFSGISMSASEVTRDLTTEKDFRLKQKEKQDLETVSHAPSEIAMQDEGGDDGEVGW